MSEVRIDGCRIDTLDSFLFDKMNHRDPDLLAVWMQEYAAIERGASASEKVQYEFFCFDCADNEHPIGQMLTQIDDNSPEGLARFQGRVARHQERHQK